MIANPNISCPGPSQLRRFLNCELSDSDQKLIEEHVETCTACQSELDRLTSDAAEALSIPPLSVGYGAHAVTLAKDDIDARSKSSWPSVPGYTIRRELGRGARGVVYLADDARLRRLVAVKVIKQGIDLRPRELSRFRTEAEAMARLRHANIIPIYDVGENDGRPFLAMEYLEGGSLGDAVGQTPQLPRTAAALVEALAKAMHHAHQRGVIHRDLKPGNVLLAAVAGSGADADATTSYVPAPERVKITDFGLAKLLDEDKDRTGLTMPGEPMGTPSYMSPEQANGDVHEIGIRSDVYALGAVLYKLLTGHAPYEGSSKWEVIKKVQSDAVTPTPPRQCRPDIPRDLEAICLKCLEKEPARRYASADTLAHELRRFLNGDALRHTGRVSVFERMWRWGRRNPAWGTAAVLAIVVLAGLIVVPTVVAFMKENHNQELKKALRDTQYQLAINHLDQGLNLCEQGNGGVGLLKLAQGLAKTPDDAHDLKYVFRNNLASWPDRLHTLKTVVEHGRVIHAVAFAPDGRSILTAGSDGARLWDISTGEMRRVLPHPPLVRAAAFSPDGTIVVTAGADRTARLWDTKTGKAIGEPIVHRYDVNAVAFSPDGLTILTGCGNAVKNDEVGTAQLWDAQTRKPLDTPAHQHRSMVNSVAFSPDGKSALSGGWDNRVIRWDVSTGRQIGKSLDHSVYVTCIAFSPEGRMIVTASHKCAQMWNADTGQPVGYPLLHGRMVQAVAFSPDGRYVLTGSYDKTARLWDVRTGKLVGQSLFHPDTVRAVAFSPDGRTILTGSDDGVARLWESVSGKSRGVCWEHGSTVRAIAFSADGKLAVSGSYDGTAQLWDTANGASRATLTHSNAAIQPKDKWVQCVAISRDGKLVLTGGFDNNAQLWDAVTGKPGRSLLHADHVSNVAFGPDGRIAITGSADGTARVWNLETGDSFIVRHGEGIHALATSPDGRIALTGSRDKTARLWEVRTGATIAILPHEDTVRAVAFSPDVRKVLTASTDNAARLWDVSVSPPQLVAKLLHQKRVTAVTFSPDGQLALTSSLDNTACLWDAVTGKPWNPCPCLWHPDAVQAIAFTPDGHSVLCGGADGTVRLWDVATGRQVGPPMPHEGEVHALGVNPNGAMVLAGSTKGDARLWKLPMAVEGDNHQVTLTMRRLLGMKLHDSGMVEALDVQAWRRCRQELEQLRDAQ